MAPSAPLAPPAGGHYLNKTKMKAGSKNKLQQLNNTI